LEGTGFGGLLEFFPYFPISEKASRAGQDLTFRGNWFLGLGFFPNPVGGFKRGLFGFPGDLVF